jgi:hypothetical protein
MPASVSTRTNSQSRQVVAQRKVAVPVIFIVPSLNFVPYAGLL